MKEFNFCWKKEKKRKACYEDDTQILVHLSNCTASTFLMGLILGQDSMVVSTKHDSY